MIIMSLPTSFGAHYNINAHKLQTFYAASNTCSKSPVQSPSWGRDESKCQETGPANRLDVRGSKSLGIPTKPVCLITTVPFLSSSPLPRVAPNFHFLASNLLDVE
jgi:hypothetical protein